MPSAERKPTTPLYLSRTPNVAAQTPLNASNGLLTSQDRSAVQLPSESLTSSQIVQAGVSPKALAVMGVTPTNPSRVERQPNGASAVPARLRFAVGRPRPIISGPRPQSGRDGDGPNSFEYPRPAPQKR
jgi:hypothetical protein